MVMCPVGPWKTLQVRGLRSSEPDLELLNPVRCYSRPSSSSLVPFLSRHGVGSSAVARINATASLPPVPVPVGLQPMAIVSPPEFDTQQPVCPKHHTAFPMRKWLNSISRPRG